MEKQKGWKMRLIKCILFIPMLIIEVFLMILCIGISFISDNLAYKILELADKLPDNDWYFKD